MLSASGSVSELKGLATASFKRRSARAKYDCSLSQPTKLRLSSNAATPVVPDPMNGSKTTPPMGVDAATQRRINPNGF
jgi:hypothetical protein